MKCNLCKKRLAKIKTRKYKDICRKCYKYFCRVKYNCSICNQLFYLKKKNPNICNKCYSALKQKHYTKQYDKQCSKCGKVDVLKTRNPPLCKKCYIYPQKQCSKCNKTRRVAKYLNNKPICNTCYDYIYKDRIINRLRKRLNDAILKDKKADEYGINYQEIKKHLGPCPGKNYHIDHIFPISAFDFNNLAHIQAAFAPDNHQWLTKQENLSKSNKYDSKQFLSYMDSFVNKPKKEVD